MVYRQLFVMLAVLGTTLAFAGEFVPKSYYVIDHNGHKSSVIYLRNKRSIPTLRNLRFRRSQGTSGASSFSSSSAGAGSGAGNFNFDPSVFAGFNFPGFDPTFFKNLMNNIEENARAAGARSFTGQDQAHSNGGFINKNGLGDITGQGPTVVSRFGEAEGTGIGVSGRAAGPSGAFTSSSSSIDANGKIKYSVRSGQY